MRSVLLLGWNSRCCCVQTSAPSPGCAQSLPTGRKWTCPRKAHFVWGWTPGFPPRCAGARPWSRGHLGPCPQTSPWTALLHLYSYPHSRWIRDPHSSSPASFFETLFAVLRLKLSSETLYFLPGFETIHAVLVPFRTPIGASCFRSLLFFIPSVLATVRFKSPSGSVPKTSYAIVDFV